MQILPLRAALLGAISVCASVSLHAEVFVIDDIKIQGLERIAPSTVFAYLPVRGGQSFDTKNSQAIIDALYQSGLFADVALARQGRDLLVSLKEYPVIAEINFKGNRELKNDALREAMTTLGLVQGRAFNPSQLNELIVQLTEQYQARSKYSANIDVKARHVSAGRVALDIEISEGRSATIQEIVFVGNRAYDDKRLSGLVDTTTPRWHSFITRSDQFNPERITQDLGRIENYYHDRGFFNFAITDSQIALSPDKQSIVWTINLHEGAVYTNKGFSISGESPVEIEELARLVEIDADTLYNRSLVQKSHEALMTRLADEGYALAEVEILPQVDELNKEIFWQFNIVPNQTVYVREIHFEGNKKTRERVLRRELRQEEGALYSSSEIKRGEERLRRLPQVVNIEKRLVPVVGKPNQVDIYYKIEERSTSYIQGGIGYGESSGAMFNLDYTDDNFFGTGNRVNIGFGRSSASQNYSFTYFDPYFTADGISANYNAYYQSYNYKKGALSDWASDGFGALVTFGYPLSEYQSVFLGGGYRGTRIKMGEKVAKEIADYVGASGRIFHEGVLTFAWDKSTTDQAYLPNKGSVNRVELELASGQSGQYFKSNYRHRSYFSPASESVVLGLRADLGYGASFSGDTLPFYRRYYAGGVSSVRGFGYASLGPRFANGDKAGGDLRTSAGVDLMLPIASVGRDANMRFGVFFDAGTVFKNAASFDSNALRYSTGVALQWISPIGPLSLSYALPLNDKQGDTVEKFQFTVGSQF